MALFVGFAFPFQKSPTAFPAQATDDELIKQSLTQLILTGLSERVMRPEVGSNAYRYIFEDNDQTLETLIQTDIQQAVGRFEPRVALLGVTVTKGDSSSPDADATVEITINYIVVATRTMGTLTITLSPGSNGL